MRWVVGCLIALAVVAAWPTSGLGAPPGENRSFGARPLQPVSCRTRASQLDGDAGDSIWVDCPQNCGRGGRVWGSERYSGDSAICPAAIHAGAIGVDGGAVRVTLRAGLSSYSGSERNGVQTGDFGAWHLSFAVGDRAGGDLPTASCYTRASDLGGAVGGRLLVDCPSGCRDGGQVWGSDIYAPASSLCRAALHGGAIGEGGGLVNVRVVHGRRSYAGSQQNGVVSLHRGAAAQSFLVRRVPAGKPAARSPAPLAATCATTAATLGAAPGETLLLSCPPACQQGGPVYGTELYSGDSSVCRAAMHAGALGGEGGTVELALAPGQSAYEGMRRAGIQSLYAGPHPLSFAFR